MDDAPFEFWCNTKINGYSTLFFDIIVDECKINFKKIPSYSRAPKKFCTDPQHCSAQKKTSS